MAEKKTATKDGPKSPERATFSDEERAAVRARAQELKAEASARKNRAEGQRALLAAIAKMSEPECTMATRVHAIVDASAPSLWLKTWYGMPAYAKEGKVVCFFKSAEKFKSRYATLGFEEAANLDEGAMWPT